MATIQAKGSFVQDVVEDWARPSRRFLGATTPEPWIAWALCNQAILLVDHANCERKAAATAMSLMQRHPEDPGFVAQLSKLAREELVHFEQVLRLMDSVAVPYQALSAGGYAAALIDGERRSVPGKRIDRLIISAIIEARSCERFAALAPRLEDPLKPFYLGLLKSEARHFEVYLRQAERLSERLCDPVPVAERSRALVALENRLILSPCDEFRFHSGVPSDVMSVA